MADKALRLKMERGQCMDLFPVPASAVAQALAPFGLEERDALSDLLPEGTFYSPLGPSDVQSGDQGDAASYTLGKKLKKSQYVRKNLKCFQVSQHFQIGRCNHNNLLFY